MPRDKNQGDKQTGIDTPLFGTKEQRKYARKLRRAAEAESDITLYCREATASGEHATISGALAFLGGGGDSPHVSHNSGENEWYTPPEYIDAARKVMGGIDLDPASSDIANSIVQAETYYTVKENGLEQEWFGRVWLNPPYGQPSISHFAEAVVSKRKDYDQACVLVNNATETDWLQKMLAISDAVCFHSGRIKFYDKKARPANAPLQGQVILYFGNRRATFKRVFSHYGWVCHQ